MGKGYLVQIGMQFIDHLDGTLNKKEMQQAYNIWKQVHLSTVISKRNAVKGLNIPEYDLKGVKGKIHTLREVVILSFVITVVKGIANLMTHSKYKNVAVEPVMGYPDHVTTAILKGY